MTSDKSVLRIKVRTGEILEFDFSQIKQYADDFNLEWRGNLYETVDDRGLLRAVRGAAEGDQWEIRIRLTGAGAVLTPAEAAARYSIQAPAPALPAPEAKS